MKRCDLHIHTVPSVSDRMFTYDKDVLLDYVAKTKLDVIAITITTCLTTHNIKKSRMH